jgi:hypothetical protein
MEHYLVQKGNLKVKDIIIMHSFSWHIGGCP